MSYSITIMFFQSHFLQKTQVPLLRILLQF